MLQSLYKTDHQILYRGQSESISELQWARLSNINNKYTDHVPMCSDILILTSGNLLYFTAISDDGPRMKCLELHNYRPAKTANIYEL